MDHVGPVLAQNVCDFPREEQIFVGFAMAISGIFIWKETKLIVIYPVVIINVSEYLDMKMAE